MACKRRLRRDSRIWSRSVGLSRAAARRSGDASVHADELIGLLPLLRRQRLVEGIQGRLDLLDRGEMLFRRLQVQIDPLRRVHSGWPVAGILFCCDSATLF